MCEQWILILYYCMMIITKLLSHKNNRVELIYVCCDHVSEELNTTWFSLYSLAFIKKTKDWALVQNAALVGVEVSLG